MVIHLLVSAFMVVILVLEHPLRLLEICLQGHLVEHTTAGCIVLRLHGVYVACQVGVVVTGIVHANAL